MVARRVALVSMPWLDSHVPSAALAAVAAYTRRFAPEFPVEVWPEHLRVASRIGFSAYRAIRDDTLAGEALYAGLVYPERRQTAAALVRRLLQSPEVEPSPDLTPRKARQTMIPPPEQVLDLLDAHAEKLATRLAAECAVVGFTTPFRQLFATVLVSRRIKALNPDAFIVWGGSATRGEAGPAFLREYPEIDCIIQGEGERPFVALLRGLAATGRPPEAESGILTRGNMGRHPAGVPTWEAEEVTALPPPEFDSFRDLADPLSVEWRLWIQTARGCWWDRSGRTGNPLHRCLFCNMNERRIYQAKPPRQVAAEVDALVERHGNPRIVLNDLSMRPRGITALSRALAGLGRELDLQMEIRAGIRPRELLALWEAGLRMAHTGIEGFSTAYLRRLGKGATVIQNLELLKTCTELEIANPFSLVTDFPGSTAAEVAESVDTIERCATAYPPSTHTLAFSLTPGSAVDECREAFGVLRVRNHSLYREFLPPEVCERLILPHWEWEFTPEGAPADWTPVREACRRWATLHEEIRARALREDRSPTQALIYVDGASFLEVTDFRGVPRRLHLYGPWREIYLTCLEIRTGEEISARFSPAHGSQRVHEILERCVAERIMFTEGGRYLSLASATRPDIAARRIRHVRR